MFVSMLVVAFVVVCAAILSPAAGFWCSMAKKKPKCRPAF